MTLDSFLTLSGPRFFLFEKSKALREAEAGGWQLQSSLKRLDRDIPVSKDKNKKAVGGFCLSGVRFLGIVGGAALKWAVPPAFPDYLWLFIRERPC